MLVHMKQFYSYKKFSKIFYVILFTAILTIPESFGIYHRFILTPQDKINYMVKLVDNADHEILPLADKTYEAIYSNKYQNIINKTCRILTQEAEASETSCAQLKEALHKTTEYLNWHKVENIITTNVAFNLSLNDLDSFNLFTIEREYELIRQDQGRQYFKLALGFTKYESHGWSLTSIYMKTYPSSITKRNSVFNDISILEIGILMIFVLIQIFVLSSVYLCFFKTNLRFKWFWAIFIVVGIWTFDYNFAIHQFTPSDIDYLLYGAGYAELSPYGPINIMLSVPVGAIIFMIYYLYTRKYWSAKSHYIIN